MKQLHKFRSNYLFAAIIAASLLFTLTWKSYSQGYALQEFYSPLTYISDTIPLPVKDSINKKAVTSVDTTGFALRDTLPTSIKTDTFSLKISKDTLDAPVRYEAADSVVILVPEKLFILYGRTKTEYKDITLTAPKVEMDQQKNLLTAVNTKDSAGLIIESANFKQGENAFTSDTIYYNFKTQKGLTKNTVTRQGEFFVIGKDVKKIDAEVTYVKEGLFTTCNLDDPHFAFRTNKMKVINNKLAISGPAHPEFEGVPVPIYLPFGFYPLSKGRHSGFLKPQFTNNEQYGLGLEGLGYYKVLTDFWDVRVYGNIYSFGGWSANVNPTYRKRYKYSGSFNFSMQSTKLNFKGDPDFLKNNSFFVSWGHSVDSRARPGINFSANVNAGSTKYNRFIPNDPNRNFQNQLGSSVSYSKTWKNKPLNLTVSANHSQNNFTRLINLSLPNAGFTVNTFYPFQKKDFAGGQKWYEKLGVGYNGTFSNTISFYDTLGYGKNGVKPFLKYLLDTAQWAAHHNIPITLSLPPILGGSIMVAPGISYNQDWLQRITTYQWDAVLKKVDTITRKGLFIDQRGGFSLSFNTAIFGILQFKKSRVAALRHVIRPMMGFSFTPDLNKGHIKQVQVDTTGRKIFYNEIGGGILFYTKKRKSAAMNFGIDNNLEMKWRSKTDSGEKAYKKIRLIDGFGFSGGYDFLRDSLNLSSFQLYFRTNLFEKISITANATLDPYETDSRGRAINKYVWQAGKFSPGRITNGGVSMSTSFQSKPKDPQKEEQRQRELQRQSDNPEVLADQQRLLEYMRQNPSEFVDFNIPWQVSLSLSVFFYERLKPDFSGFEKDFNSNVNFNGSFNLTPKWNFNVNGYYDFNTNKLQTFQLGISRDMHCWQMAINVTPIGLYRFFNISLNPKASVLQDLRINRTRYFTSF